MSTSGSQRNDTLHSPPLLPAAAPPPRGGGVPRLWSLLLEDGDAPDDGKGDGNVDAAGGAVAGGVHDGGRRDPWFGTDAAVGGASAMARRREAEGLVLGGLGDPSSSSSSSHDELSETVEFCHRTCLSLPPSPPPNASAKTRKRRHDDGGEAAAAEGASAQRSPQSSGLAPLDPGELRAVVRLVHLLCSTVMDRAASGGGGGGNGNGNGNGGGGGPSSSDLARAATDLISRLCKRVAAPLLLASASPCVPQNGGREREQQEGHASAARTAVRLLIRQVDGPLVDGRGRVFLLAPLWRGLSDVVSALHGHFAAVGDGDDGGRDAMMPPRPLPLPVELADALVSCLLRYLRQGELALRDSLEATGTMVGGGGVDGDPQRRQQQQQQQHQQLKQQLRHRNKVLIFVLMRLSSVVPHLRRVEAMSSAAAAAAQRRDRKDSGGGHSFVLPIDSHPDGDADACTLLLVRDGVSTSTLEQVARGLAGLRGLALRAQVAFGEQEDGPAPMPAPTTSAAESSHPPETQSKRQKKKSRKDRNDGTSIFAPLCRKIESTMEKLCTIRGVPPPPPFSLGPSPPSPQSDRNGNKENAKAVAAEASGRLPGNGDGHHRDGVDGNEKAVAAATTTVHLHRPLLDSLLRTTVAPVERSDGTTTGRDAAAAVANSAATSDLALGTISILHALLPRIVDELRRRRRGRGWRAARSWATRLCEHVVRRVVPTCHDALTHDAAAAANGAGGGGGAPSFTGGGGLWGVIVAFLTRVLANLDDGDGDDAPSVAQRLLVRWTGPSRHSEGGGVMGRATVEDDDESGDGDGDAQRMQREDDDEAVHRHPPSHLRLHPVSREVVLCSLTSYFFHLWWSVGGDDDDDAADPSSASSSPSMDESRQGRMTTTCANPPRVHPRRTEALRFVHLLSSLSFDGRTSACHRRNTVSALRRILSSMRTWGNDDDTLMLYECVWDAFLFYFSPPEEAGERAGKDGEGRRGGRSLGRRRRRRLVDLRAAAPLLEDVPLAVIWSSPPRRAHPQGLRASVPIRDALRSFCSDVVRCDGNFALLRSSLGGGGRGKRTNGKDRRNCPPLAGGYACEDDADVASCATYIVAMMALLSATVRGSRVSHKMTVAPNNRNQDTNGVGPDGAKRMDMCRQEVAERFSQLAGVDLFLLSASILKFLNRQKRCTEILNGCDTTNSSDRIGNREGLCKFDDMGPIIVAESACLRFLRSTIKCAGQRFPLPLTKAMLDFFSTTIDDLFSSEHVTPMTNGNDNVGRKSTSVPCSFPKLSTSAFVALKVMAVLGEVGQVIQPSFPPDAMTPVASIFHRLLSLNYWQIVSEAVAALERFASTIPANHQCILHKCLPTHRQQYLQSRLKNDIYNILTEQSVSGCTLEEMASFMRSHEADELRNVVDRCNKRRRKPQNWSTIDHVIMRGSICYELYGQSETEAPPAILICPSPIGSLSESFETLYETFDAVAGLHIGRALTLRKMNALKGRDGYRLSLTRK